MNRGPPHPGFEMLTARPHTPPDHMETGLKFTMYRIQYFFVLHLISTTSLKHILLEAKPAVVDLKRETSTDLLLEARFAQHSLAGAVLLIPVPSY